MGSIHPLLQYKLSRWCGWLQDKPFIEGVSTATRLFQSGTDEQLIMQPTGHRSTDGVRVYKRTSAEQEAFLSKVLNREKERQRLLPLSALGKENEKPQVCAPSVF